MGGLSKGNMGIYPSSPRFLKREKSELRSVKGKYCFSERTGYPEDVSLKVQIVLKHTGG